MNSKLREGVIFFAAIVTLVAFLQQLPSRQAFQTLELQVQALGVHLSQQQTTLSALPGILGSAPSLSGKEVLKALSEQVPSTPAFQSLEQEVKTLRGKLETQQEELANVRTAQAAVPTPETLHRAFQTLEQDLKHEYEQQVEILRAQLVTQQEEVARLTSSQASLSDLETVQRAFQALQQDLKQEYEQQVEALRAQLAQQQAQLLHLSTQASSTQASSIDQEVVTRAFQSLKQDLQQEYAQELETLRGQLAKQQAQMTRIETEQAEAAGKQQQAVQVLVQEREIMRAQLDEQHEELNHVRSAQDQQASTAALEQEVRTLSEQLVKQQERLEDVRSAKASSTQQEGLQQHVKALEQEVAGLRTQLTQQRKQIVQQGKQLSQHRKQLARLTSDQAESIVAGGLRLPWYRQLAQASLSALPGVVRPSKTQPVAQSPVKKEAAPKAKKKGTIALARTTGGAAATYTPAPKERAQVSTSRQADTPRTPATGEPAQASASRRADELLSRARGPMQLAQATFSGPPGIVGPPGARPHPYAKDEEGQLRIAPTIERGGLLLRKGRWQVEPTLTYSHLSKNRIGLTGFSVFDVIFIGQIRSEEIDRDIVVPSLNVRYGLTNTLEAEAKLPLQYRRDEELKGPIDNRRKTVNDAFGLTDIEGGFYYHFAQEQGLRPHMIADVRVKAPTGDTPMLGSGSWGAKSGLIMVKISDPVVLYSKLGYYLNFPADIEGVRVNPGDSFEYGFGLAYSLNYNLSLNGGFEQLFTTESSVNGAAVNGSHLTVANLKAGLTWALSRRLSLDFAVGAGLTEDSPDLTVSFSVPYTF